MLCIRYAFMDLIAEYYIITGYSIIGGSLKMANFPLHTTRPCAGTLQMKKGLILYALCHKRHCIELQTCNTDKGSMLQLLCRGNTGH